MCLNKSSTSRLRVGEDLTCHTTVAAKFLSMSGVYGKIVAINLNFLVKLLLALNNSI